MNESTHELAPAKKAFSRIGLAFCAILVIATVLQVVWFYVPSYIWGENNWFSDSSWGMWIGTFAPLYLIAIPAGLLIMGGLPAQKPQENKLSMDKLLAALPICFCLMYSGSLIGTLLSLLLSCGNAQNTLTDYANDSNPIKILVMVILAPLLEEYICRKQIIDRTRQYGEKTAVIFSALVFGLLHQNLYQFFYAFALGLVFAYIYTRTGRLRYPVLLHSIVNFFGAVIAPWIVSLLDMEKLNSIDPALPTEQLMALYTEILPGLIIFWLYLGFIFILSVMGLVLLVLVCLKLSWKEADAQLPKGSATKTVYLNVGMILYILLCFAAFILALL